MAGFFILVVIIAILGGLFSTGHPLLIFVGLGIIAFVIKLVSDAHKDEQEGITRIARGKDFETLQKKRWAIQDKHGRPKPGDSSYEACQKELNELNSSIRYGTRTDW